MITPPPSLELIKWNKSLTRRLTLNGWTPQFRGSCAQDWGRERRCVLPVVTWSGFYRFHLNWNLWRETSPKYFSENYIRISILPNMILYVSQLQTSNNTSSGARAMHDFGAEAFIEEVQWYDDDDILYRCIVFSISYFVDALIIKMQIWRSLHYWEAIRKGTNTNAAWWRSHVAKMPLSCCSSDLVGAPSISLLRGPMPPSIW